MSQHPIIGHLLEQGVAVGDIMDMVTPMELYDDDMESAIAEHSHPSARELGQLGTPSERYDDGPTFSDEGYPGPDFGDLGTASRRYEEGASVASHHDAQPTEQEEAQRAVLVQAQSERPKALPQAVVPAVAIAPAVLKAPDDGGVKVVRVDGEASYKTMRAKMSSNAVREAGPPSGAAPEHHHHHDDDGSDDAGGLEDDTDLVDEIDDHARRDLVGDYGLRGLAGLPELARVNHELLGRGGHHGKHRHHHKHPNDPSDAAAVVGALVERGLVNSELLGMYERGLTNRELLGAAMYERGVTESEEISGMYVRPFERAELAVLGVAQTCVICGRSARGGGFCPSCQGKIVLGLFERGSAAEGYGEEGGLREILGFGERGSAAEGYGEDADLLTIVGEVAALETPASAYAEQTEEPINLTFATKDQKDHVAAWRHGPDIYASARITGWDGQPRILTATTPYHKMQGVVVGYAERAGVSTDRLLPMLHGLTQHLGAGALVRHIAVASPAVLRHVHGRGGPLVVATAARR